MSSVFRWLAPVFTVLAVFGLVHAHSANAQVTSPSVVTQHEVFALASGSKSESKTQSSVLSQYAHTGRYIAHAEDLSITASSFGKVYTETAESGDGTTHLARKAIHEFIHENGLGETFTRAQRVYAEDFLKNHFGNAWLTLGETRDFSAEELATALDNARAIDPTTLDSNLAPYVAQVDWSYYEELKWQSVSGGSSATLDQQPAETESNSNTSASNTTSTENTNRDVNPGWILVILLAVILILGMYFYVQARNDEFRLPEEAKESPASSAKPMVQNKPAATMNAPGATVKVVEPVSKPAGVPAKPATPVQPTTPNKPAVTPAKPAQVQIPGKPVVPAPSLNPNKNGQK